MAEQSSDKVVRTLPRARVRRVRRFSFAWFVPLAALVLAGYLGWRAWSMQGVRVTIRFPDGHGIRVGDAVRHKGVIVGEVDAIALSDDLTEVITHVVLHRQAERIARQGTLFWIVRPMIGPSGVSGLDTLVGPRYIAILPSRQDAGVSRRQFTGLAAPPVLDDAGGAGEDDLEIIVEAPVRGSLQPGGPVMYKEFRVGRVLDVGLASDGSAIEARLNIDAPYAQLVTPSTRFWDSGGVELNVALTGITLAVESLEGVLVGSVSFATPPDATRSVHTGHRFQMALEREDEWLTWRPMIPIGHELLPSGASLPTLERAQLDWERGIFQRDVTRSGWVLPIDGGVIGPEDLLVIPEDAHEGVAMLEVAGKAVDAGASLLWTANGLACVDAGLSQVQRWPRSRMRRPSQAEDCLLVTSDASGVRPLAAVRVRAEGSRWLIDESINLSERWHGAAVLSRVDGALVGMLIVSDGEGVVALTPERLVGTSSTGSGG